MGGREGGYSVPVKGDHYGHWVFSGENILPWNNLSFKSVICIRSHSNEKILLTYTDWNQAHEELQLLTTVVNLASEMLGVVWMQAENAQGITNKK